MSSMLPLFNVSVFTHGDIASQNIMVMIPLTSLESLTGSVLGGIAIIGSSQYP